MHVERSEGGGEPLGSSEAPIEQLQQSTEHSELTETLDVDFEARVIPVEAFMNDIRALRLALGLPRSRMHHMHPF